MADITLILTDLAKDVTALIVGKLDLGSLNAAGKARVTTAGGSTLCDIDLADPAFTFSAGAAYVAAGVPHSGTASGTGTAGKVQFLDKDENVVFEGMATLVGGGGPAELDKLNIESGDTVTLQSASIDHPDG